MQLVQDALSADPEHSLAHAIRGFYYYGERHQRNGDTINECVAASAQSLDASDVVAGHYCNALTAASSGDAASMVYHLEQQLLNDPTEKSGRQAVEINPSDVWGTHAVTHVMYMQGRSEEGARWLDQLHAGGHWQGLGQMVLHLWWHRALFHLLRGEHEAALTVYDEYLRNFELDMVAALPDLYLDLQNATSLLLRLEFLNTDVGSRWTALADICSQRVTDPTNAFSCPHYAAVLAADNRFDDAEALIANMSDVNVSRGSISGSYTNAAIPAAIASVAHRKQNYRKVIDTLMPVRHRLVQMGGSHAQREVFLLMLADALQRENESIWLQQLSVDLHDTGFADIMAQRIL